MVFKLKDKCYITMGQSPKGETYNNSAEGMPFLQGRKTFNEKYPSIDTWTTQPLRIAKKNSILMSVRAPVGDINVACEEVCIGRGLCSLEMKNGNNEYLYYLLLNNIKKMREKSTGTIFDSVNRGDIENLELFFHDDIFQEKISKILSSIDKKIEINNRINKNLQKLSQELYKRWFVDFEFPDENGKPYKSSGGVMVESELGEIPEGWKIKQLGDACNIKYGKNLPTNKLLKDGYPVFGGNGIIGYYSDYIYEESQLLISCRGAASGKVLFSYPFSYVTNNSLILETNKDLYFYLKEYSLLNEYYQYTTGSAQPQITIENIRNIKVIVPKLNVLEKFKTILDKVEKKHLNNLKTNSNLEVLRDTLLPKLMNGEIDIDKIEI